MIFCDWLFLLSMFSRSIHVVADISTSFNCQMLLHCMDAQHLSAHLLMDIWVVSNNLLAIMNNRAVEHYCTTFCVDMFPFLLGVYILLILEWLGHVINLHYTF